MIGIRTGIGIGMGRHGALLNYQPETKTYVSGLTTPISTAQKKKIDKLVRDLKTGLGIANLSDVFDIFYILSNETAESSLRNLVKNSNHATSVNAPVFTPLEGFEGNGVSSYVLSGYIPSLHALAYKINKASAGIYLRKNILNGAYHAFGCGGSGYTSLAPRLSNNTFAPLLNNTGGTNISGSDNTPGMFVITRDDDVAVKTTYLYRNKVLKGNIIHGGTDGLSSNNLAVLALNVGSIVNFSTVQASVMFAGKNLTSVSVGIVTDAIEGYMDSNGKGVIA